MGRRSQRTRARDMARARMPNTARGAVSWPVRGSSPLEAGAPGAPLAVGVPVVLPGAKSAADVRSATLIVAPPASADTEPMALCSVPAAVDSAGRLPPRLPTSVATELAGAVTVLTMAPRLAGACTVAVRAVSPATAWVYPPDADTFFDWSS